MFFSGFTPKRGRREYRGPPKWCRGVSDGGGMDRMYLSAPFPASGFQGFESVKRSPDEKDSPFLGFAYR
jgi:hypothetical protein